MRNLQGNAIKKNAGKADKKVLKSVPKLVRAKRVDASSAECPCRWCRKSRTSILGKIQHRRRPNSDSKKSDQAEIPVAACLTIQESLSISTSQTLKMATAMRKETGRASVEPNLRQAIMERDGRMEGLFSHVVLTSRDAPVCAIVCNDVSDLLQHVVRHRQVDPHDHSVKVGIDGGGGMLKVSQ